MATVKKLLPVVALMLWPSGLLAQDVQYYHLDAIGNVRAVTNQSGTIVERHDYLPFGEECTTGGCATNPGLAGGQPKHFTGKERDTETGLDYFGARYYGSKTGRFTTVDPAMNIRAGLSDPQRWNRYAYAYNNPLKYLDPTGREGIPGLDWEVQQAINRDTAKVGAVVVAGTVGVGVAVEFGPAVVTAGRIAASTCAASAACRNGIQDLLEGAAGTPPTPRATEEFAEMAGMLRQAGRGKGNFGVGSATAAQAEEMGRAWVGDGAALAKDAKTVVSADGLRQYRPPSYKPRLGRTQANLESRLQARGAWQSNAHVDIKDKP